MTLEYIKVGENTYKRNADCPHNTWVVCDVKNCYHCGWNPKVEEIRKSRIFENQRRENDGLL